MAKEKNRGVAATNKIVVGTKVVCQHCGHDANGVGHDGGICFFKRREDQAADNSRRNPASIRA